MKPVLTKLMRLYFKNKIKTKGLEGVAQMVEYLHEALGSIPSTVKKKNQI
jgi:hypothetical protein